MSSLYIHIPFCHKKCGYCSFPVIPTEKLQEPAGMGEQYKLALFRDMAYWARQIQGQDKSKPQLKTIYFGGGTPLLLGAQYLIAIIANIGEHFDLSELQELTIECNPYPYGETVQSVQYLITTFAHIPRVRFSFGIQSLDDTLLQQSNRDCTFAGLQQFTKDILSIKQPNVLYNFDFIAFGDTTTLSPIQLDRLQNLVSSHIIDSFSLYTLELFAGAKWYHETKDPLIAYQAPWDHDIPFTTSEDSIFDQFSSLKKLFLDAGYARYEISNYSLPGKECIHNQTYWTMGEYIGIGLGAHGFVIGQHNGMTEGQGYRTENSGGRKHYITGEPHSIYKTTFCSSHDILIEGFFLGLRQLGGIRDISKYSPILVSDRQERIQNLEKNGLASYKNTTLCLTDTGMNVHHQVCTYLMQEI